MASTIVVQFVSVLKNLDINLVNHLRVILATDGGTNDLKRELGLRDPKREATGKAISGRTIELFSKDVIRRYIPTVLMVLMSFSTLALGQDDGINHAPTAEQCKADIAVWKAESNSTIVALPINMLLKRSDYLSDCYKVLSDANEVESASWVEGWQGVYDYHAVRRAVKFIKRHNLSRQFVDEDAKGAR